jgi:multidrug efflux pump subunit AcrA (membrane-fusion protein)
MILPISDDLKIIYASKINPKTLSIYWFILLIVAVVGISLPIIKLDISVTSTGIIRPINEKTELRSSVSAIIDSIYFREGEPVKNGDTVLLLHKENSAIKINLNDFEIQQRDQFIADLTTLTHCKTFNSTILNLLQSPVYKQECSQFVFAVSELNTDLEKVNKEMSMDSILFTEKVIAPKEMFDKKIEHQKLIVSIKATEEQKIAGWQQDLTKYQLEKNQYENANQQILEDDNAYAVKAPISGILQSFNKYYQGSLVQAGDVLAEVSPQTEIIAECYVDTKDIGLLKLNQHTIFQIDAFDYNYFGILTGKIISIDNDYTLMDNKPVFKVRCILDTRQLHLKNGFAGDLKKGMTLQARFIVARRSLWQLLFDKLDDWMNPSTPNMNN